LVIKVQEISEIEILIDLDEVSFHDTPPFLRGVLDEVEFDP